LKYYSTLFGTLPLIVGGNTAFLKDVFVTCGGYDVTNPSPMETEWGLGSRLGKKGKILWLPTSEVETDSRRFEKGIGYYFFQYYLVDAFISFFYHRITKKTLDVVMEDIR
jgi:hypothetical protein